MTGPEEPSATEHGTEFWQDDYEDIFGGAADTTRQKRPQIFDPSEVEARWGTAPRPAAAPPPVPTAAAIPVIPAPPLFPLSPPKKPRATRVKAVTAARQEPPPLPPPPEVAPQVVRAVIADDDLVLQHILGYQLAHLGWKVTCVADGMEVSRLLKSGVVDLLLVDLNLPHRNAYEILEDVAALPRRPKVMVLSEQVQEDKVVRAFKLGADDFVQKPLNPRVVMSRTRRLVGRE